MSCVIPALLIKTSTESYSFSTVVNALSTDSAFDISIWTVLALPPAAIISLTISFALSTELAYPTTTWKFFPSAKAIALPMPLEPQ